MAGTKISICQYYGAVDTTGPHIFILHDPNVPHRMDLLVQKQDDAFQWLDNHLRNELGISCSLEKYGMEFIRCMVYTKEDADMIKLLLS